LDSRELSESADPERFGTSTVARTPGLSLAGKMAAGLSTAPAQASVSQAQLKRLPWHREDRSWG